MAITEKDINVRIMTENRCYIANRWMNEQRLKIMVHSTGCPATPASQWFDRWNNDRRSACVHAFMDDKEIWQYLPWTMRGWHAGGGENGSANNDHISFEICEPQGADRLTNKEYFNKVYPRVIDFLVFLCKKFNISSYDIIDHREGHALGIACNHGDVAHWWKYHGKTMDDAREEVRRRLGEKKRVFTHYKLLKSVCFWDENIKWTARSCKAGSEVEVIDELNEKFLHCRRSDGQVGYVDRGYITPTKYKLVADEYTILTDLEKLKDERQDLIDRKRAVLARLERL